MPDITKKLELRNAELRALGDLSRAGERLVAVPIVDDYYPEVSYRYSSAFVRYMDAVCKTHFGTSWAKVCDVMNQSAKGG